MADEVFMDIPEVQKISKSFQTFADTLDAIEKALQAISMMLKLTSWISFGATEAVAQYIDRILPNFKNLSDRMKQISGDITSAINAYQNGDLSGSKHFV